jgi:hypothetical protein
MVATARQLTLPNPASCRWLRRCLLYSATLLCAIDRLPRVGHLDGQLPLSHLVTLQFFDRSLLLLLVGHLDETETLGSRWARLVAVVGFGDDASGFDLDVEVGKDGAEAGVVDLERQVGDEEEGL